MTDLVAYTPPPQTAWVDLLPPAAELARQIAGTEFVPTALRGKPAAVTACILYGQEIGIGPMQALAKVHVVEGRPAPSAELGRALALAAGHEVWVEDQTNTKVTVAGRRAGSDIVQRITWTMDDAKRAGLDGRTNYRKYPRQMLLARASAELVRMMFPDVLGGVSVFAEELEDTTGAAEPVAASNGTAPATGSKRQTRNRTNRPTPALPAAPQDDTPVQPEPPLPGEPDEPPAPEPAADPGPTDAQIRKLMATYRLVGLEHAHDQKRLAAVILGLDTVDSHKHLTRTQASTLIDTLVEIEAGNQAIVWGDDGPCGLTTEPPEPDDTPDEDDAPF